MCYIGDIKHSYIELPVETAISIEYPNYEVEWKTFNVPNDKFTEVLDNWFTTPIDKKGDWDWSKEVCGYKFKLASYVEMRSL